MTRFIDGDGFEIPITRFSNLPGRIRSRVIIMLGLANLLADGFAMSVGSYLSAKSKLQHSQGFIPILVDVVDQFAPLQVNLFAVSILLTSIAFAWVGCLKSQSVGSRAWIGILETLILGMTAALVAYLVGDLLATTLMPAD